VDYASFLKAADRGEAPPVTLLHGAEAFLIDDAVSRVTHALFADVSDPTLLKETFDAKEAGAESVVQAALMLPWGSARRLVVARGVEDLTAKQGEALAVYVRAPNPSTVLLLLAGQALTAAHWLMQAMPSGSSVAVAPLVGRQLIGWLRARARTDGFELDEAAAELLADLSGNDLTRLRGDIEKAALAGGPDNRRVSVAEVRAVVGEHRLHHIFELTQALAARDTGTALRLLELLLNAGEDAFGVLGMLAREVRALWQAAEGLRLGRSEEDIARALRRPPHAAAALIDRARVMPPSEPARLLTRCWDVERRLKLSGSTRPEVSLLVADLCAG